MKKSIICLLLNLFYLLASAQTDTTSYAYANKQYENKNYPSAIAVYEKLIQSKGASVQVYYNLGNAYYKTNQIAKSILNYERCLQINPGDNDAKFNLAIVNLRIKDKLQPVDTFFLLKWWNAFVLLFTANSWAFISLFFIWLAITGFALFRLSKKMSAHKAGFYLCVAATVFFILSFIATLTHVQYDKNNVFAVIMEPSAIVKSEPSENSTNLFILHEGLKIRILDSENEWTKIKMEDGNIGWLLSSSIEKI